MVFLGRASMVASLSLANGGFNTHLGRVLSWTANVASAHPKSIQGSFGLDVYVFAGKCSFNALRHVVERFL